MGSLVALVWVINLKEGFIVRTISTALSVLFFACLLVLSATPAQAETKKVRALAIGVVEGVKPDYNGDSFRFDYYSNYWPSIDTWWLCFIVVNYGDKPASCTIRMKVKGPKKTYVKRKAILQPDKTTLFIEKIKLASKVGIYNVEGSITGDGIKTGRKVISRFYINEVIKW